MVCSMVSPMQHWEWYSEHFIGRYIQHLPDSAGHTEKMKSHTVPVQFQYGVHSARDRSSFQDHHTLCTSNNSNDSKAGRISTCTHTSSAKYFTEWTSSTLCTCPQAAEIGLQTKRLISLEKIQHLHNGRTSVNRLPLTKQDILSHYSGCFEGIGHFLGELYKFHLKPEYKLARHAPRKVPTHLEAAFKEEIKSLVKLGILEEVKEHTDWVNSYVIVEKDSGNTTPQITPSRGN